MKQNELIIMTIKESKQYSVIKELIDNKIDGTDAAKQLSLSLRQVKRIKAKVKVLGVKGVIHANRGQSSHNRMKPEIVVRAKKLLHERYNDFNPLLAQEHLRDDDKIFSNKETVRRWMIEEGLWKPRKKSSIKKHFWRKRKDNYGEMQQFDGSYHNWFEGRNIEELGDEQCLLLAVDDAKGVITHAEFADNEGVLAVFHFWRNYFREEGLPISIYLDKFSTYKINHPKAVDNEDLMTQFERAMKQLGVRVIHANSAQAKGRVEKMNGTLQRRLVKEMRLAKINSTAEANIFLKEVFIPKFNAQFGVVAERKADLHRKLSKEQGASLDQIMSIHSERVVNNDYTVRFDNKYYQLEEIQPVTVYKKDRVTIEEHLNGDLKICLRNRYLNYFILPERPKKEIDVKLVALTKNRVAGWKPPLNHPWRMQFLNNKRQPARVISELKK